MAVVAKLLAKMEKSAEVLKQDGALRFLERSALSLSVPVRLLHLRAAVAADAKRALAKVKSGRRGRGLFIDCGSNIGQGFKFFSKYYTPDFYDYILVEPNRNCIPYLRALNADSRARIEIVAKAAGVRSGNVKLFGPPARWREPTYGGCSTIAEHNSSLYEPEEIPTGPVEQFSLAELIMERHSAYDVIVIKMDIEGSEYEILSDIVSKGVHCNLHAAYIEFHSLHMENDARTRKRIYENEIRQSMFEKDVIFRDWI